MLNDKFQCYAKLEEEYLMHREVYGLVCDSEGVESPAAVQVYEFLQGKMRELVSLNDSILNHKLTYHECEEACDE